MEIHFFITFKRPVLILGSRKSPPTLKREECGKFFSRLVIGGKSKIELTSGSNGHGITKYASTTKGAILINLFST